jgi:hypothetical protein
LAMTLGAMLTVGAGPGSRVCPACAVGATARMTTAAASAVPWSARRARDALILAPSVVVRGDEALTAVRP